MIVRVLVANTYLNRHICILMHKFISMYVSTYIHICMNVCCMRAFCVSSCVCVCVCVRDRIVRVSVSERAYEFYIERSVR